MRAVIYARYSSLAQNEQSIDEQIKKCVAYATVKQIEIVDKYIDKAKSASKNIEKRTEFLKMIDESYKNKFDCVIVYKLDRFSRDEFDTKKYEKILKDNGVEILSATESYDPNTIEGFILKTILQMISQIMPKQLSPRVKDGMNENASKCFYNGGVVPLGFKIVNKKYVVDENTKIIVQAIFDRFKNGVPPFKIIEELNKLGYKTSTGNKFTRTSLESILHNEKYIGTYKFNGIEQKNAIEPIIDIQTWNITQSKLKTHTRKIREYKNKYMLSGKVYCSCCDNLMWGESTTKNGTLYHSYYSCKNKHFRIDKEVLESKVYQSVLETIDENLLNEIVDRIVELNKKKQEDNKVLEQLQTRKKELDNEFNRIYKLCDDDSMIEKLKPRLKEISHELDTIENEIAIEKKSITFIDKDELKKFIKDFFEISAKNDEEKKNRILYCFVNKVIITSKDECDVYLNITKNEPQLKDSCYSVMVHRFINNTNIYFCI